MPAPTCSLPNLGDCDTVAKPGDLDLDRDINVTVRDICVLDSEILLTLEQLTGWNPERTEPVEPPLLTITARFSAVLPDVFAWAVQHLETWHQTGVTVRVCSAANRPSSLAVNGDDWVPFPRNRQLTYGD